MPETSAGPSIRRAVLAVAVLAATLSASPAPAAPPPAWLERLNAVRAQAGLRPVGEDSRLAGGLHNHARYIVKTDDYRHGEDPSSPYYTPSGDAAGGRSNLAVRAGGAGTPVDDIDQWLRAPFHALGLLHPALTATAYANYYDGASPGYTYASGIDVLARRDGSREATYPVTFPAHGSTIPTTMASVADEIPSPLTPCGYSLPAGLPVIVTFGPAVRVAALSAFSFTRDGGTRVEACATTAADYADPAARNTLAEHNSVLVIPKAPLQPGSTYTAKVSAAGITETVSFTVARAPSWVDAQLLRSEVECGDATEVVARLVTGAGSPGKQSVQLWSRLTGGDRPWQLSRTATTGRDGLAGFTVRPGAPTEYQVRFPGNAGNHPSRSPARTLVVTPEAWHVTAEQYEHLYVQTDRMELSGNTETGAGARIVLQAEQIDGSWAATEVTGTAGADGAYELTVPLSRPGRHVFRVVALPVSCHRVGHSEPITVTVALASSPE